MTSISQHRKILQGVLSGEKPCSIKAYCTLPDCTICDRYHYDSVRQDMKSAKKQARIELCKEKYNNRNTLIVKTSSQTSIKERSSL